MKMTEQQHLEMTVYEAFIRRAAAIDMPFMLKGSYVGRQYFKDKNDRMPADLDWVYLQPLHDVEEARKLFNEWATLVTEHPINDGVTFVSFKENEFWRMIDYAMADDFPTVNTDLKCLVNGEEFDFSLDISFNLDMEQPPVPMLYQPMTGDEFTINYTVPLSLQVSWKIHQSLVRPRFKDLFDLIHLVSDPGFDEPTLTNAMQALVNECRRDNVSMGKFRHFLEGNFDKLFPRNTLPETWDYWRYHIEKPQYHNRIVFSDWAERITDPAKLPETLAEFIAQFKSSLQQAGLDLSILDRLPLTAEEQQMLIAVPAPEPEPIAIPAMAQEPTPLQIPVEEKKGLRYFISRLFGKQ